MDDEITTQLGLLLTQLRFTRRALEDIERSTAKYGGVTFALALAAGPHFGEPPLLNGALKVYIININDLAPGRGIAGFIEGLLGGLGRFLGGFAGGLAGGTIGGIALVVIFNRIDKIVQGINQILDRLGIRGGAAEKAGKETEKKEGGTDWAAAMQRFIPMIDALTALFKAASTGPESAAQSAGEALTKQAKDWAEILKTVTGLLDAATRLVNGLIFLVPILIGAFAMLIVRLADVKLAILEMLQFVLRMVLLLRGVTLVTLYDTIAAAARLAASVLTILQTTVGKILDAVFAMIGALLSTVQEFIRFIGAGLKNVMDGLLDWLVNGLGRVLTYIADLRIFRVLIHLLQVLPNLLPSIIFLKTEKTISDADRKLLEEIKGKEIPGPTGPALSGKLPKEVEFPDLGAEFLKKVEPFKKSLDTTSTTLTTKAKEGFDAARKGMTDIDAKMKEALTKGEPDFYKKLEGDLKTTRDTSTKLAGALTPAVDAARKAAEAGEKDELGKIAKAYEGWLAGGGLDKLLGLITVHLQKTPTSGPAAVGTMPAAAVGTAAPEPVRATVEIKELIIDLEPTPAAKTPAKAPARKVSLDSDSLTPGYREDDERYAYAFG
ncbi:MAG: hypothetical protein HY741_05795 [Chloroflexi bacterium]|nr:hypothetical protein [Chloroflexota bacterium]